VWARFALRAGAPPPATLRRARAAPPDEEAFEREAVARDRRGLVEPLLRVHLRARVSPRIGALAATIRRVPQLSRNKCGRSARSGIPDIL
jgi:hypothetical protein